MDESAFLPLPEGMMIEQVEVSEARLTVVVVSTQESVYCPGCGRPSEHIHSHYQRTVTDVPCGGRSVVLRLRVRKFFCLTLTCPRKVFAERLADLVQPWARVSNRLLSQLQAIGLSASAEVSERLTPRLAMNVKAPTLLRCLRRIPPPADASVRVLGIDDFAIKRGDTYGTIFVNIETGKPLDLLPDHTADAVLPWLASHQEIEVVSRDRASAYADAVKRALPHAVQVADRYHLIQNLREHVQRLLDHKRTCLPKVEDRSLTRTSASEKEQRAPCSGLTQDEGQVACPVQEESELAHQPHATLLSAASMGSESTEAERTRLTYAERQQKISRDKRAARYEEIRALYQAGMGQRAIARHLGIRRKTVKLFVSSSTFPERAEGTGRRASGKGKLDAYVPYLRERWEAGMYHRSPLFDEIKQRGYTGSASLLGKLLSEWRSENCHPNPGRGTHENRVCVLNLDSVVFPRGVLPFSSFCQPRN